MNQQNQQPQPPQPTAVELLAFQIAEMRGQINSLTQLCEQYKTGLQAYYDTHGPLEVPETGMKIGNAEDLKPQPTAPIPGDTQHKGGKEDESITGTSGKKH